MKWLATGIAVAVGMGLGLTLSGRARGQEQPDSERTMEGAVRAARITEVYKMCTDVREKGPKPPERVADDRTLLHVPDYYGQLVTVTSHGADAVVWYRDSAGALRNAVVTRAAERLVRIDTVASESKEMKFR